MKTVETLINELQVLANQHGKDTPVVVYDNNRGFDVEDFNVEYNTDDEPAAICIAL